LHRAEETQVKDFFLIGDELPHPTGYIDQASFQLNDANGDAVQVDD